MKDFVRLLVCASTALACRPVPAQQSLHLHLAGTIVEGSFGLAGKVVPLPPGKFKLVYQNDFRTTPVQRGNSGMRHSAGQMVQVLLVPLDKSGGVVALRAQANLGKKARWAAEPCKRDNVLLKVDRLKTYDYRANCLIVNHDVDFLSRQGGYWADIHDRLQEEGFQLPLPLVLGATLTRIEQFDYLSVTYWVNPLELGYAPERAVRWATSSWHKTRIGRDAEKAAFAAAFGDWATRLMPALEDGFEGKPVAGKLPQLELPRKTD